MFSYDQYHSIFIIGLIMAGVFLVVSAILFFVLRIPAVIGYLSGSTAKKAIEEIKSGKAPQKSKLAKAKEKNKSHVTEQMPKAPTSKMPGKATTASLSQERPSQGTKVLGEAQSETIPLEAAAMGQETAVLTDAGQQTSVLRVGKEKGTIVSDSGFAQQTTVLNDETSVLYGNMAGSAADFTVRVEIVLFVSHEIIA